MRYQTRGPDKGQCSGCGVHGKLTEDHTPPKSVPRIGQADLMRLAEAINAEVLPKTSRYFQNGVKFKSMCDLCNNVRLGVDYDPHLAALANSLDGHLRQALFAPFHSQINLNRALRSVAGHMLAQRIEAYRDSAVREMLCTFFLDQKSVLPSDWYAYAWAFPYKPTIYVDAAVAMFRATSNEPVLFAELKFYPIAFMFTQSTTPGDLYPITRLDELLTCDIDDTCSIDLNINGLPPMMWPEAPVDKESFILHGDGSLYSIPRKP